MCSDVCGFFFFLHKVGRLFKQVRLAHWFYWEFSGFAGGELESCRGLFTQNQFRFFLYYLIFLGVNEI